ncbi:MAG: glycosyltransferase family 2 protein [Candidatus Brocadiales bacterium]|nr:glycosyltransferase family 2 protein [Candidatus Brocadiales bacterium]
MYKGLSVILPVYNEGNSIIPVLRDIESVLKTIPLEHELIVVNDGSTDSTAVQLHDCSLSGLSVFKHERNEGYGAALKTGLTHARYENVVIVDADGSYPVELIPKLVAEINDSDMVVGARIGKNVKMSFLRRLAKGMLTSLARYLSGKDIPDLNSGLRAMRKEAVIRQLDILPDGFSFTSTITIAMLASGNRIKYIPIDYYERVGKSKIRPFRDTINFMQLIIRTATYFSPLRVFVPISLFFFFLSIIAVLHRIVFRGGLGVTAVILFVTAIQLLSIGILADVVLKKKSNKSD